MEKIGILTDSNSGVTQKRAKELGIGVLPMPFCVDGTDYLEDIDLTREQFFEMIADGAQVNTSQPSPESVMHLWDEALKEYDTIVYIPMSSALSGSCQTAQMLAMEEDYAGKVFVVDNGRVSTPLLRSVLDAMELRDKGYNAKEIKELLEKHKDSMTIYVAVETLEYLVKGGRLNSSTAMVGNILHLKPVLKFGIGMLETYKKARGFKMAQKAMIEAMKHDMETIYKEQVEKGEFYLLAASSATDEVTKEWVAMIEEQIPGFPVLCDDLPISLCCHIGPGGLGIGCSCKPVVK